MDIKLTITEQEEKDGKDIMQEINNWLSETYGITYNKSYELYKQNDEYSLYLHLNNQDRPMILSGQFLSDSGFIDYVKKELKAKKPFLTKYFMLYRTDEEGRV